MDELKIIVFNVDQGLCVFARTPRGYGVMIDCGRTGEESSVEGFSPVKYVAEHEAPYLEKWQGRSLAKLIVTHPHDDHVEDIDNLKAFLRPGILLRHKNYDWTTILHPPDGDPSRNATTYHDWQSEYNVPVVTHPDYGLSLQTFALTPQEATAINPNTQNLLNNSSYVTVFTYHPYGQIGSWKVVVAGDNETAGWEALLKKRDFAEAVRGADFFVTAHYGHESGFSDKLFEVMGNPILNISSVRARDHHLFDRYNQLAQGTTVFGAFRKHLTTRNDGHIVLWLREDITWDLRASNHAA